jgi:hypothetical protein
MLCSRLPSILTLSGFCLGISGLGPQGVSAQVKSADLGAEIVRIAKQSIPRVMTIEVTVHSEVTIPFGVRTGPFEEASVGEFRRRMPRY